MYRGGNWNNGENAGLFYLNGNNPRSNSNTNIGFRSALASFVRAAGYGSAGTLRQKGYISRPTRPKINARRQRTTGTTCTPRRLAVLCERAKGCRGAMAWQP